jgi:hypothetical protein
MLPHQISKDDPAYMERVAELAYRYWEMRGCPIGSSDEDWFRAEQEITRECGSYGPLRFDGQK